MIDPRMTRLAEVLVNHSCQLRTGEKVLIEAFDVPDEFVVELIRTVRDAGAVPFPSIRHNRVLRAFYEYATREQMEIYGDVELHRMKLMDAYMGIRGAPNANELSDVPPERMRLVNTHHLQPVHLDERVNRTKWAVLRWPSPSMAQQAQMSTEAFEDFFFRVCTLDYSKLSEAMDPLVELMENTDRVQITAPGTELGFSIRDLPAVKCEGRRNLPDGEVFTAPVKESVNGVIQYNTPTTYQGIPFENIRLELRDGRIVDATASGTQQTERLNAILDEDEGARFVGEFSLGVNPHIHRPIRDILFDEKIAGSLHFTPGQAYERADNGNRSQIHWDLVLIQTEEYGGGEIRFDGRLIRKDGRFTVPELEGLNPENFAGDDA